MAVFIQLHQMALRNRYDPKALLTWLNNEISNQNLGAAAHEQHALVTKKQIQAHFSKHLSLEELLRQKVTPAPEKEAAPFPPVVERRLRELTAHASAVGVSDLDDFQQFHRIVERMNKRFESLDKFFDDPEFKPDRDLLLAYKAFGDSVSKMLTESIKLRQQERLFQNAVMSTLETMSVNSLQSIIRGVERMGLEVRPLMREPEKVDSIVATLREHVAESLSQGTKTALDHLKSLLRVA